MPVPEVQFDELYRELILDHYRNPRHRGTLDDATHHAEGLNPTCGDEVYIDLVLDDETVQQMAFEGQGCSISQASTSMLSDMITGKRVSEARDITKKFEDMLVAGQEPDPEIGDLEAFQGVAKFHARIKCATLAAKVLEDALESPVSAQRGG